MDDAGWSVLTSSFASQGLGNQIHGATLRITWYRRPLDGGVLLFHPMREELSEGREDCRAL